MRQHRGCQGGAGFLHFIYTLGTVVLTAQTFSHPSRVLIVSNVCRTARRENNYEDREREIIIFIIVIIIECELLMNFQGYETDDAAGFV